MTTDPTEGTPVREDTATWSQEPAAEATPLGEDDSDVDDDTLDPRTRAYVAKLKKESQGLRARLRDAEEMIGAASAQASVHTREAVAAAAAQAGLIDGNDLFLAHPDPDEFLDERFKDVVGSRVEEATKALLARKPYLGRTVGAPPSQRPIEGLRPGAAPEPKQPKATSWFAALHGLGG